MGQIIEKSPLSLKRESPGFSRGVLTLKYYLTLVSGVLYSETMEHQTSARYRARAIPETIQEQGRSVAWLSRKIGLSRQYTSDVVHGRVSVRHEVAERISKALEVGLSMAFEVSVDTESVREVKAS